MGKQLYEKSELYRAIHNASHWAMRGRVGSNTPSVAPRSARVEEALARLSRCDQRRGSADGSG